MIKSLVIFLAILTGGFVCSAADTSKDYNWVINFLQKKIGPSPCCGAKGDLDTIREDKKPGQQFFHIGRCTISGKATAASERLKGWWKTTSTVNFGLETILIMRETIISSDEELNQGIVRQKFEVLQFNENLITAKGAFDFHGVSTASILSFCKAWYVEKGGKIDEAGQGLMDIGLLALMKEGKSKKAKRGAIVSLIAGSAIKSLNWIAGSGLSKYVDKDGYWVLSKNTVQKLCPEYDSFVSTTRELDDSIVETTWEYGKGFTDIRIKSRANQEYQEMLASFVYRSNPVLTGKWYPQQLDEDKIVDAAEIGGTIFSGAVACDKVSGAIRVRNRGIAAIKDEKEVEDIIRLNKVKKEDVKLEEIGIVEDGNNIIRLKAVDDGGKVESISASFMPSGSLFFNKTPGLPCFVKNVILTGTLDAQINNKKGFLQEINVDERDAEISVNYVQRYVEPKEK